MKHIVTSLPVCSTASVKNVCHYDFDCPSFDGVRSRMNYRCLFKGPWSLKAVLQDNPPLICIFMFRALRAVVSMRTGDAVVLPRVSVV
jgi:hypothetical protein